MMTSGMYQNAGEFCLARWPAGESGVGGGIVAIVPQEMAIAVCGGPELDERRELAGRRVAYTGKPIQRMGRSVGF